MTPKERVLRVRHQKVQQLIYDALDAYQPDDESPEMTALIVKLQNRVADLLGRAKRPPPKPPTFGCPHVCARCKAREILGEEYEEP